MNTKRITAIVPIDCLQNLEKYLRNCGVPGVTVETVRGYGEHPNYFRKDLMQNNAKLILYTVDEKVEESCDDGVCEGIRGGNGDHRGGQRGPAGSPRRRHAGHTWMTVRLIRRN
jgi:nitrogen regulatory protein P-II 1